MQFQRIFHAMSIAAVVCCTLAISGVAESRECRDLFSEVAHRAEAPPRILDRQFIAAELSRQPNDAENGFVTDKLPVTAEVLLEAYSRGVFPYETTPEGNGSWFSPPKRGVMPLDFVDVKTGKIELNPGKIGSSDRKAVRKLEEAVARGEIRVSFNEAFEQVMRECAAQPRMRRNPRTFVMEPAPSWISKEIIDGYTELHRAGHAISVEVWSKSVTGEEVLVGGTYGVITNGVFTGESMFHKMDDVAKLATVRLGAHLSNLGFKWMDVQIAPPTTVNSKGETVKTSSLSVKWGAVEIPRDEFRQRITESRTLGLTWRQPETMGMPVQPAAMPAQRMFPLQVVPQQSVNPDTLMSIPHGEPTLIGVPL